MLHAIDHVNLVVSDLGRMVEFYCSLLGLRQSRRVTISGRWIDAVVGLSGVRADVVYLELPEGPRVELLQYLSPEGTRPPGLGESNTMGLRHLAFRVSNIETIRDRLGRAGVRFFNEVQQVPPDQVSYAGGRQKYLVYFHDPEGNLLELCEYRHASA